MAIYAIRPVLAVMSLSPSDLGDAGIKSLIVNNGMKIKKVTVQCASNRILFRHGKYELDLDRFLAIEEYSVPDVGTGESFTADCTFSWSLWTGPVDGFFVLGGGGTEKIEVPEVGMAFRLNNGVPHLIPGRPIPEMIRTDFIGYAYNQVTAIDGSIIVRYSWPWSWFRQETVIHIIAERPGDSLFLQWRAAPKSQPVVKNVTVQVVKLF